MGAKFNPQCAPVGYKFTGKPLTEKEEGILSDYWFVLGLLDKAEQALEEVTGFDSLSVSRRHQLREIRDKWNLRAVVAVAYLRANRYIQML